jgi:hypothetical protein
MNPLLLPASAVATPAARSLPVAPPSAARGGLWDHGNRHKTLIALGTGLLSGGNFSDGVARAGQNVLGLEEQLRAQQVRQREYGGPDDAFEITTDPVTGERTTRGVPEFQEYLEQKRTKQKDVADINGRVMYALQQLPEEQRAAAYANIRANPHFYGVDPANMPEQYDPVYASTAAGMGMTVSQAMTRRQAADNAADLADYRGDIQRDRETRTGIYRDRSTALTSQGAARIGQAGERIAISKAKGSGKGSGGSGGGQYEYRMGPNGRIQKRLKR